MGAIANSLGLGTTIEHDGHTYTLSPWTYKIQGEFERYLEDNALRTIKRMRPICSDAEFGDLLAAVHRDISAGHYNFGGAAVAKALNTFSHLQYLVWLCLKPNHPDIKLELVADILRTKMDEIMDKMNQVNEDPNGNSPAATAVAPGAEAPAA